MYRAEPGQLAVHQHTFSGGDRRLESVRDRLGRSVQIRGNVAVDGCHYDVELVGCVRAAGQRNTFFR